MFVQFNKIDPKDFSTQRVRVRADDVKSFRVIPKITQSRIHALNNLDSYLAAPRVQYNVVEITFYDDTSVCVTESEQKVLNKLTLSKMKAERREANNYAAAFEQIEQSKPVASTNVTPAPSLLDPNFWAKRADMVPDVTQLTKLSDTIGKLTAKDIEDTITEILSGTPANPVTQPTQSQASEKVFDEVEQMLKDAGAELVAPGTYAMRADSIEAAERMIKRITAKLNSGTPPAPTAPFTDEDPAVTKMADSMARRPGSLFSRVFPADFSPAPRG